MVSHADSGTAPARSPFHYWAWSTPLMLVLAACNGAGDDTAPGAVSEGEAQALDEAAEMLDERRLPTEVLPQVGPENGPAEEPQTSPELTGDSADGAAQ